jgi:hypothetical protein
MHEKECFLFTLLILCLFDNVGLAYPVWSENNSSVPSIYSPTNLSEFNITWQDNVAISKVLIEINSTGTSSNYTMTNTYGGNVYNYSIVLPDGTFTWKSYANDTNNSWNSTLSWTFTISPASSLIVLENNLSWSGTYPASSNTTGSGCPSGISCTLYRNSILVDNPDLSLLSVGKYNYTYNTSDNRNYSSNSISYLLNVQKAIPLITISNGTHFINTSDLVAYWKFESINSTNYTPDSSGQNNDGILNNFNTSCTGRFGYALNFDGTEDFISVPSSNSLNITGNAITLSAWVRADGDGDIIATDSYMIRIIGGNVEGRIKISNASVWQTVNGGPVSKGLWHHLTMRYNGTHESVFVDGKTTENSKVTGNLTGMGPKLKLGYYWTFYNGTIDEVTIFNRALDNAEISMLYGTTSYPVQTIFSYATSSTDSNISFNFYQNDTLKSSPDINTYGIGYYYYFVNTSGGTNYLNINSPIIPLVIKNPKTTSLCFLMSLAGWSLYNNSSTIISCICNGDGDVHLYRNEKILDKNTISDNFTVGNYYFVCNITETENYTSASNFSTLIVKQSILDENSENIVIDNDEYRIKIISNAQDFSKQSTDEAQYMTLKINLTNKNNRTISDINFRILIPYNGTLNLNEGCKNSDDAYQTYVDKLNPLESRISDINYCIDRVDVYFEELKLDFINNSQLWSQKVILKNSADIDMFNITIFIPSNFSKIFFTVPRLEANTRNIAYEIKFSMPIEKVEEKIKSENTTRLTGMYGILSDFISSNPASGYIFTINLICVFIIISYIHHRRKEKEAEKTEDVPKDALNA